MVGDYISRSALRDRVDKIIKVNHLRPDYVWFTPNGVKALALEIPAAEGGNMRIIVDKLPASPKECLFAKRNVERGYICPLQHCSCSIEYGLMECPCLSEAPTIIPASEEGE